MEYCEFGDLNNHIKLVGKLTEKETKDITWQVLVGLSLMHEARFAHRDVKPAVSLSFCTQKVAITDAFDPQEHSHQT